MKTKIYLLGQITTGHLLFNNSLFHQKDIQELLSIDIYYMIGKPIIQMAVYQQIWRNI